MIDGPVIKGSFASGLFIRPEQHKNSRDRAIERKIEIERSGLDSFRQLIYHALAEKTANNKSGKFFHNYVIERLLKNNLY